MKKRKKQGPKRRNASRGAASTAAARGGGSRSKKNSNAVKNVGVAVAGGALGALAAGIAVGAGVKPQTAAIATLAGGAVGAYALKGTAKVAAIGAACAASGQLALAWQVKRQAEQAIKAEEKRKETLALNAPAAPAPSALPAPPAAMPKRNGYEDDDDDDGGDDLRNAGEVEEYADDYEYAPAA